MNPSAPINGPELAALIWATNGDDRRAARMRADDATDYRAMLARERAKVGRLADCLRKARFHHANLMAVKLAEWA